MLDIHSSNGKGSLSTVDNRESKHSNFENMLFERVVAKSHEEITDKDILDLDGEDSSGSESDGQP